MSETRSPKSEKSPADRQFDAYHKWLGIPPDEQPPNHYRLLGIRPFEADAEVIQAAAERQVVYLRQCAVGPYGDISQKLLNEVSQAQVCLLVPEKRAQYDARLKAETAKSEAEQAAKAGRTTGSPGRAEAAASGGAKQGRPSSMDGKPKKKSPRPEQVKQLRDQASELIADGQTAAAIQVLQKLAGLRQPAYADDAKWARDELAVIDVDPEQMREQADAAFRLAQRLMRRNDYEQAVQLLDEIPAKFRSTKFQHLHTMARDAQDEVDVLVNDLEQAIADDHLDGMLPTVKRLLELKPGHQLASRLHQQLTGKAAPTRRSKKKKAAWAMIPAIPGMQVGDLARSGGSLALWAVGLVVVVGGLGWGIVQLFEGGEKTLGSIEAPTEGIVRFDLDPAFLDGTLKITVDGKEVTAEQLEEGLELPVGEHELIVTKDGKEIHKQTIIVGGVEVASINLTYDGSKVTTAVETPLAEEPLTLPDGDPGEVWVLKGHKKDIRDVAISPNGRYLVSSSSDGTARLWDLSTGTEVRRVPAGRYASTMDFSADGKFLLTNGDGQAARLINLEKGKVVRDFPGHSGYVSSVTLMPDGKSLVTTGQNDGTVRRWNLEDGKEQWAYRRFGGSAAAVQSSVDGARVAAIVDGAGVLLNAATGEELGLFDGSGPLAFSPDGRLLTGTGGRESLHAWNAADGVELATWPKGSNDANPAFSSNLRLAAGRNYSKRDNTLQVWDTTTGKGLAEFEGHKGNINCVAFAADGRFAATGGRDGSIRLWRMPAAPGGDPLASLQPPGTITDEGEPGPVRTLSRAANGLQVPAEGDLIAALDSGVARVWNWRTGVLVFRSPGYNPSHLDISADGRYVLTASSGGLHLWDLTGKQPVQRVGVDGYTIRSLDISPDNRSALVTVHEDRAGTLMVVMLDLISGRETLRTPVSYPFRPAAEPTFSPTGGMFAVARDNFIVLHDSSSGQELHRLEPAAAASGSGSTIVSFGFSGDGRRLVAADSSRALRVYDVGSGALVSSQLRTRVINSLAVSNTGRYVIAAAPQAALIDLSQNRDLPAFASDDTAIQRATFLPGEKFAAFRSNTGNVQLWRLPALDDDPFIAPVVTRQEIVATPTVTGEFKRWSAHRSGGVQGLEFSGDGRTLASASTYDGDIKLWEVTAVKGAATSDDIQPQDKFTSGDRGVGAVAFSPDSSKLVAGLYSGGIFEVDLKNRKETRWSESAAGMISSVAWTPDGNSIVTTSAAQQKNVGPIRLWDRQTGKVQWQYDHSQAAAGSATVTADGASTLVDLDGTITRLDLRTGERQGVLTGQKHVTVSPDQRLIATSESDGIHLWDAASGQELRRLLGYTTIPEAMTFSDEGKYLIVGSNAAPQLRLWDVATGQLLLQKKITGQQINVHALAISPDRQHVAVGMDNGRIGWWSLPTIPSARPADSSETPDSGTAPSGSSPLEPGPAGEVARIELPVSYAESPALSADGKYVVAKYGNRIKAWEVATGKLIFKSPYYRDRSLAPAITPGGREVLIPFASEVLVMDVATGAQRKIPRPNIQKISVAPDGKRMLLLSSASRKASPVASIVDIASGEQVGVLADGKPQKFSSIAWSPDGSSIAVAIDEDILLYATDSGNELRRFSTDARKATVYDLAFEASGLRLFSWGRDNQVRLWNVGEGTEIRSIRADARSPAQLTDDARIVGTGNQGLSVFGTDRLKKQNDGRTPNNPAISVPAQEPIGRISGLAIATGQPFAVTTVSDGTIRFWRLPAAE